MKKFLGRHLMVKGRYVGLILSGKKTLTIRYGIVKPKYREIIIHGGGRPIAKAEIVRVYHKKVKELTDNEALKDGFSSREELLRELNEIYGSIGDEDFVTAIEFRVVQRLDNLPLEHPYMGLEPGDLARLALRYLDKELTDKDREILIDLTRTNSIRATAIKLFGGMEKRYIVRRTLKKVLQKLVERRLIKGG